MKWMIYMRVSEKKGVRVKGVREGERRLREG